MSVYTGEDELRTIPDEAANQAAEQCGHFLALAVDGTLARLVDPSHDAYPLITTVAAAGTA